MLQGFINGVGPQSGAEEKPGLEIDNLFWRKTYCVNGCHNETWELKHPKRTINQWLAPSVVNWLYWITEANVQENYLGELTSLVSGLLKKAIILTPLKATRRLSSVDTLMWNVSFDVLLESNLPLVFSENAKMCFYETLKLNVNDDIMSNFLKNPILNVETTGYLYNI